MRNDKSYAKLAMILKESAEGIFVAVASLGMQKKIAAFVRGNLSGKAAVFDYFDLPDEDRYYSFQNNVLPAIILSPEAASFFFFNAQEALKTREDFLQFNFSRDMLTRERRNIIFS